MSYFTLYGSGMFRTVKTVFLQILLLGVVVCVVFVLRSNTNFHSKFIIEDSNIYRNCRESTPTVNKTEDADTFTLQTTWNIEVNNTLTSNSSDLLVLVIVTSSVDNFQRRLVIRDTWASQKYFALTKLRVFFLLGDTKNATIQARIDNESAYYRDILQMRYLDTYRNLTYKIASGLSWASEHAKSVPWIAKVDDDVIVNPFGMVNFLKAKLNFNYDLPMNIIYGRLRSHSKPFRNGKYIVSKKEYPYAYYPPHLLGSAYILGQNALQSIVEQMNGTRFLWLEDVFLTGLVASKAKVPLQNIEVDHFTVKANAKFYRGKQFFCVACNPKSHRLLWKKVVHTHLLAFS